MDTAIFKSNTDLERWIREHTSFEEALIVALLPESLAEGTPASIRLVLGEQISGSYEAGTERTMRDYVLTAAAVRHSTLSSDLAVAVGHCCEGIEIVPTNDGVAFRIDVPGTLEIACESLVVEIQPERRERVPSWTSDREIGATVPGTHLPSPEQWPVWFRNAGVEVCWRMHGGEACEQPPDPRDYEGWCLQQPSMIPANRGGVFFFICRERDGALVIQWSRWEASDELWRAAQRVIALLKPAEVWCGNCRFTGSEWLQFVNDASLPARLG